MSKKTGMIALAVVLLLVLLMSGCSSSGANNKGTADPSKQYYDLHLDINYRSNFLLAKYDVEIRIDGQVVGTASQGKRLESDVSVPEGKHTLSFNEKGSTQALAESDFTIEDASYYECSLKAHTASLDVIDERFETVADRDARIAEEAAAKEREEAEKRAAEEERERARQAEQDEKERVKAALYDCVGKTASESRELAESSGYEASFFDCDKHDITKFYGSVSDDAPVRLSKVTEVRLEEFFGSKSAKFILEYKKLDEGSLEGKPLLEVCETLKHEGIPFTIYGEHTQQDLTSVYEMGDFNEGDMVVVNARITDSGGTNAKLYVLSQAQIDEENAQKAMEGTLREKLHPVTAWQAVQRYGESVYGSDFKVHYYLELLAQKPIDENTWFLKAGCDAYGQSGLNCEAKVTGTNDDPIVYDFYVY